MKRVVMTTVGACLFVWSIAPAAQTKPEADAKGKAVTLSGCLAAGSEPNSFVLNNATTAGAKPAEKGTASAAKSYQVMPSADLKLAGHVGHIVELTGHVQETPKGSAGAGAKPATAMPHFSATGMKHVAPKCS